MRYVMPAASMLVPSAPEPTFADYHATTNASFNAEEITYVAPMSANGKSAAEIDTSSKPIKN